MDDINLNIKWKIAIKLGRENFFKHTNAKEILSARLNRLKVTDAKSLEKIHKKVVHSYKKFIIHQAAWYKFDILKQITFKSTFYTKEHLRTFFNCKDCTIKLKRLKPKKLQNGNRKFGKQTTETDLVNSSQAIEIMDSEVEIVEVPETEIVEVPDTEIVEVPDTEIVEVPETEIWEVPETESSNNDIVDGKKIAVEDKYREYFENYGLPIKNTINQILENYVKNKFDGTSENISSKPSLQEFCKFVLENYAIQNNRVQDSSVVSTTKNLASEIWFPKSKEIPRNLPPSSRNSKIFVQNCITSSSTDEFHQAPGNVLINDFNLTKRIPEIPIKLPPSRRQYKNVCQLLSIREGTKRKRVIPRKFLPQPLNPQPKIVVQYSSASTDDIPETLENVSNNDNNVLLIKKGCTKRKPEIPLKLPPSSRQCRIVVQNCITRSSTSTDEVPETPENFSSNHNNKSIENVLLVKKGFKRKPEIPIKSPKDNPVNLNELQTRSRLKLKEAQQYQSIGSSNDDNTVAIDLEIVERYNKSKENISSNENTPLKNNLNDRRSSTDLNKSKNLITKVRSLRKSVRLSNAQSSDDIEIIEHTSANKVYSISDSADTDDLLNMLHTTNLIEVYRN